MSDMIGHLEVEQLLGKLHQLKGELSEEVDALNCTVVPAVLDQQAFGRVSRGDALQQKNMAKANLEQCQQRIKQIDSALKKIDQEAGYGYCDRCGEAIALAHLQARPESALCINCQSALE